MWWGIRSLGLRENVRSFAALRLRMTSARLGNKRRHNRLLSTLGKSLCRLFNILYKSHCHPERSEGPISVTPPAKAGG